jgi:hypothetical protein
MQRLLKLGWPIRNDAGVGVVKKVRHFVKLSALKHVSAAGRAPLRKFAPRRPCFAYPVSNKLAEVAASEDRHGCNFGIIYWQRSEVLITRPIVAATYPGRFDHHSL